MSQGCGNWDELRQVQPSGVRLHTAYEDEEALRSSSLARRRTASMMRSPWFQSTVTARDVARILEEPSKLDLLSTVSYMLNA